MTTPDGRGGGPTTPRPDHILGPRVYELTQAGAFAGFFVFGAALALSIMLWWGWEWSVTLLVCSVGSLVGAKAAQEFAGELRRDIGARTLVRVDASKDLFPKK